MKAKTFWQRSDVRAFLSIPAAISVLLLLYLYYYQYQLLTFDFLVAADEPDLVIDFLPHSQAAEAGMLTGDRIITINQLAYGDSNEAVFLQNEVVLLRQEQIIHLVVPGVRLLWINLGATLSVSLAWLAFWGVGVLLFLRRSEDTAVRLFYVLTQTISIGVLPPLSDPSPWKLPDWMIHTSVAGLILVGPLMVHYLITFPVKMGKESQRRMLTSTAYGLAIFAIIAYLLDFPWALEGSAIFAGMLTLLALSILIFVYLRRSKPDDKRRIRLIVIGNMVAILPATLLYFLPSAYAQPPLMPQWLVSVLLIASPFSHLVAIMQYNLFHIDRLINRALVYMLISAVIFSLLLGTFFISYRYLQGEPFSQALLLTLVVLVSGLVFNRLRESAQRLIDRMFYSGWYDYPSVVEKISQELAYSLDRDTLSRVLCHQVSALMQLHHGELRFGAEQEIQSLSEEFVPSFLLHFQGKPHGIWIPGRRLDGDDFNESDLRILSTIAKQARLAFENVFLVEELRHQLEEIRLSRESLAQAQQEQLRSREEERGRFARELHDSPIQELVSMNLQLGILLQDTSQTDTPIAVYHARLTELRTQVQTLTSELRKICAELRPPMLETLGIAAALRALVSDWSKQNPVSVNFDISEKTSFANLPPEVALNIYRIVQECLTNVAKHARAKNVCIQLNGDDQHLQLHIIDDGIGYKVPVNHYSLTSNGHFGLAGMYERAMLIGAQLEIDSAPQIGTQVTLTWGKKPNEKLS